MTRRKLLKQLDLPGFIVGQERLGVCTNLDLSVQGYAP
jgi:hypothetical protein